MYVQVQDAPLPKSLRCCTTTLSLGDSRGAYLLKTPSLRPLKGKAEATFGGETVKWRNHWLWYCRDSSHLSDRSAPLNSLPIYCIARPSSANACLRHPVALHPPISDVYSSQFELSRIDLYCTPSCYSLEFGVAVHWAKMADMEKSPVISPDPEKIVELTRNTTYAAGEVKDALYIHADPNDGDEA